MKVLLILLVVAMIVTLYSCLIASKNAEKCVNKLLHGTQEQ